MKITLTIELKRTHGKPTPHGDVLDVLVENIGDEIWVDDTNYDVLRATEYVTK